MKTEMNRREFLRSFFPVAEHIRTLGGYRHLALRAVKWAVLATCLWFAWRILLGVSLDGWRALGWMTLKFVIPAMALVTAVSWVQQRIDASNSIVLRNVARGIGRVVVLLSTIATGAVLYHIWLRKPEEAVIALAVVALIQFTAAMSEKPAE
jgi:phage major head subunit gpT-like protein